MGTLIEILLVNGLLFSIYLVGWLIVLHFVLEM